MNTRYLFSVVTLLCFCGPVDAQVMIFLEDDYDDVGIITNLWVSSSEFYQIQKAYEQSKHTMIGLTRGEVESVTGPPARFSTEQYALPVPEPRIEAWSGSSLGRDEVRLAPTPKVKYKLGGWAALEVEYSETDNTVSFVRIYLKPDSEFTPIEAKSDLGPRLKWEEKRLTKLHRLFARLRQASHSDDD